MRKNPRAGHDLATGRAVYQMKVTLIHSRPPIWRRLQVESGVSLDTDPKAVTIPLAAIRRSNLIPEFEEVAT